MLQELILALLRTAVKPRQRGAYAQGVREGGLIAMTGSASLCLKQEVGLGGAGGLVNTVGVISRCVCTYSAVPCRVA